MAMQNNNRWEANLWALWQDRDAVPPGMEYLYETKFAHSPQGLPAG